MKIGERFNSEKIKVVDGFVFVILDNELFLQCNRVTSEGIYFSWDDVSSDLHENIMLETEDIKHRLKQECFDKRLSKFVENGEYYSQTKQKKEEIFYKAITTKTILKNL